jgi:hypothetical protein
MKPGLKCIILFLLFQVYYPANSQNYRILVIPEKTNDYVYIDLNGRIIVVPDRKFCFNYSKEGTAITTNAGSRNVKLFDVSGDEIIPEFELTLQGDAWTGIPFEFNGGILRTKEKGKWGGMDSKGKIAVPFIYDDLTDFNEGYALGKRDKSYYVVDNNGKEILIQGYDITYIKHFSEGLAPVEVNGKSYGFVDTSGEVVISPQFQGVGYFNGGYAWARTFENLIGFLNHNGKWQIEPQFDVVKDFDYESGLAWVQKKSSQTPFDYADVNGTIKTFIITEEPFDFSEGLAIGKKAGKFGYLNNKGEWEIMPIFDNARKFVNGYAAVKSKGGWGLIDKKGNTVLQPAYKFVGDVVIIE